MYPLIDTNSFLGSWPFSVTAASTPGQLAKRFTEAGVGRALVSPLDAVFSPDPMPANRALFAAVRHHSSLVPVPILNPALATWREHLEVSQTSAPLRAVRILPNYHGYGLRSKRLEPFMKALQEANLRLILTVRLEDERQTYFALRIKGVPVDQITNFLGRFTCQHVFCAGLYSTEIEQLSAARNFSCDISFAESRATLPLLRKTMPLRRVMFGSGAPLLSVHAQAAKVRHAALSVGDLRRVANENARRFFDL